MVQNMVITRLLIQHGMHPDYFDFRTELNKFACEMKAGLADDHASSLMMLKTHITADGNVPKNKIVIVMDAGGTNFRVAIVYFDDSGKAVTDYYQSYPMPGANRELNREEFFDKIAEYLMPVIHLSDDIGFCFSYATYALPNHDGRLIAFCKEVKVRRAEGVEICSELAKALERKGIKEQKHFVLINDTVATLLGGKAWAGTDDCFDSYVGFILGTGTNSCYIEQTKNIKKMGDMHYPNSNMIVNLESGMYTGFLQGTIDKKIDSATKTPGDHMFEKMVSGAYLGTVMLETIKLIAKQGLLSKALAAKLDEMDALSLRDVDDFCRGVEDNILSRMTAKNQADREGIRLIIESLYERAARLVAINLAAIIVHTGKGLNADRPVCVCAEGTTFHKSELFQKYITRHMKEISDKLDIHLRIVKTKDATLIGSAIAVLLN